jgi:hypothetical protein
MYSLTDWCMDLLPKWGMYFLTDWCMFFLTK